MHSGQEVPDGEHHSLTENPDPNDDFHPNLAALVRNDLNEKQRKIDDK